MRINRIWQGVRLRTVEIGADPDQPPRSVTLPTSWDEGAAAALAAMVPGDGPVLLPAAAETWVRPIAESAARAGLALPLADRLHHLLLHRRAAPSIELWRGAPGVPAFMLNLPAFHDPADGFDVAGFAEAVEVATTALAMAVPTATAIRVGMADLAGLLACLGLPYASAEARNVAACLAAMLRGRADLASSTLPRLARTWRQDWPTPPNHCVIPSLAQAAHQSHGLESEPRHRGTTAILPPGPTEALLGVETGGIAPAFSPITAAGGLTRTARQWLHARDMSPEGALTALLAGDNPFPEAGVAARQAMHDAVAPFMHEMPALLPAHQAEPAPLRQALPPRRGGYTQKVAIAGHKLLLRTGEYADGRLGEVSIALHKDGVTGRGLMDAVGAAVSLGLQHGIRLEAYVDLFAQTRFGAAGAVEGDRLVAQASSPLDYAFRHLAANYLGQAVAEPVVDDEAAAAAAPLLPLDLPRDAQRRLRLVGE